MKTHTGTVDVFITSHGGIPPRDLTGDDSEKITRGLHYSNREWAPDSWTLVGTAEVTITLLPPATIVDNKVAALKEELNAHRANATRIETDLQRKINELLAITCVPEVQS